jgi:MazG family protein
LPTNPLAPLLEVLHRLRGPEGCPWDQRQDLASAARFLADEVAEYADAAAHGRFEEAREELADLLYMVCFNWLIMNERDGVELEELARAGAEKLIRRKPHVFGDEEASTPEAAQHIWRREKAREKREAAASGGDALRAASPSDDADPSAQSAPPSALKELSPAASPLRQALIYGATAAETGFDWENPQQVEAKLHEEIDELQEALVDGRIERIRDEMGDILFAVTQLARKLELDPDACLRGTNRKFARRFHEMEARCHAEGRSVSELSLEEMFRYWEASKANDHR